MLDKCKTQIGSRCLRRWIKQPLQDMALINARLAVVDLFVRDDLLRTFTTNSFLRRIPDLDKLSAKFYKVQAKKARHGANLTDCVKAYQLVQAMKEFLNKLSAHDIKQIHKGIVEGYMMRFQDCLTSFERLEPLIQKSIDLQQVGKGECQIQPGFSEALTDLHKQI